jgi:beta-phosphoglucomutase-like phosphatase (HAD superfamily)
VKIGDTVSDIEEGKNAGMWTIGLTRIDNLKKGAAYLRNIGFLAND